MNDVTKIVFAIMGIVSLVALTAVVASPTPTPFNTPERIIPILSDADNQRMERLAAQGRYVEAQEVLLRGVQAGPSTPKLGEACRREFYDSHLALECMKKVVARRLHSYEREGVDRAYRGSF